MITARQAREKALKYIEKDLNGRSTFESELDREKTMVEALIIEASEHGQFKVTIQGQHISRELTNELNILGYKVKSCVDDYGMLTYIYWT